MGARLPPALGRWTGDPIARATVRLLGPADLDEVARLEARLFSTPWSADTFRAAAKGTGAVLLGVEDPELGIVGYSVLWCIGDHGELSNLGVAPERQGRGLGSELLDEVLRVAAARGVRQLFLEVRESNTRASGMYRRRGFEPIGRRRGYYERPREDAVVLVKRLADPVESEAVSPEPPNEERSLR